MTTFSQTIERELRSRVEGECFFDLESRERYSTAACWYKILPLCIVYPRTASDVCEVVRLCHQNEIAVIPRGGATGLAGQAIGMGIVLDFTRHLNNIDKADDNSVTVQTGIRLRKVNEHLAGRGKHFPIDPASSEFCTIGGMIGTNAAGVHGIKFGATKNHIEELTVVLSNGELSTINRHPPFSSLFLNEVITSIDPLLQENKDLILQRFPNVAKNSSGYNLKDAVQTSPTDLRQLLVGSEGTLAVVVQAKLRLSSIPSHRLGALAFFSSYEKAVEGVLLGLELEPSAVEFLDRTYVSLVKGANSRFGGLLQNDAEAMIYFEFDGETFDEAQGMIVRLNRVLSPSMPGKFLPLSSPQELMAFVRLREEASAVINLKTSEKTSFIEDVTVPIHNLAAYLGGLRSLLLEAGIEFSLYGHAGAGNIHCAPFIDLKNAKHYRMVDRLASDVADLAVSLGGTLSGEHGDGFVRTPFLERMYGHEVYELFRKVKHAFDPRNILNPGKIVGPQNTSILHDLTIA